MPKTESNPAAEKDPPQVPQYVQYAPPYAQPFEDDTIDMKKLKGISEEKSFKNKCLLRFLTKVKEMKSNHSTHNKFL